jgi:TolB protein
VPYPSERIVRQAVVVAFALFVGGVVRAQQPPGETPPKQAPEPRLIDIYGGANRLAVPPCVPRVGDAASREACATLTAVLRRDLDFEGLFEFVSEEEMSELPAVDIESSNLAPWHALDANYLVMTRAQVAAGRLTFELRVMFMPAGEQVLARRFDGAADNPRRFAHQASDEIVAATGQTRGVAATRIAFSSDRDADARHLTKEVYIADYDGWNLHRGTSARSIAILPDWSPVGSILSYVSYRAGSADIFTTDTRVGSEANITTGRGQSFAPAFSPDGKRIAYSSTRGGNSDIWVASADGSEARQLTTSPESETAPAWSPTGTEIAFTSGRRGTNSPRLYVMDAEGLNVRPLVTGSSYNDAPAWNPSRQYSEIAFTARLGSGLEVLILDHATGQVRQITRGHGSCESPSWAPSGRHLVFSCQGPRGTWQLTIADRMGTRLQPVAVGPGNNVQPDWGP